MGLLVAPLEAGAALRLRDLVVDRGRVKFNSTIEAKIWVFFHGIRGFWMLFSVSSWLVLK